MKLPTYDAKTGFVSSIAVPKCFQLDKINQHLIWEIITAENTNLRQGTHKTKTRGKVRGGGRKPWRQKGTGHARAGSIRSPIWVGGGVVFGPQPRDHTQNIPKKKKKSGYKNIIAKKIKEDQVMLFDSLFDVLEEKKISTKKIFQEIEKMLVKSPFYKEYSRNRKLRSNTNDQRRVITVVFDEDKTELKKSLRNIPWANLISKERLSGRNLLYNHGLFISQKAFDFLAKEFKN